MPQVDSNLTRFVAKYGMKHLERVPGPRKVMIIEDELDLLVLYKDYLIKNGCDVMSTSTTADES